MADTWIVRNCKSASRLRTSERPGLFGSREFPEHVSPLTKGCFRTNCLHWGTELTWLRRARWLKRACEYRGRKRPLAPEIRHTVDRPRRTCRWTKALNCRCTDHSALISFTQTNLNFTSRRTQISFSAWISNWRCYCIYRRQFRCHSFRQNYIVLRFCSEGEVKLTSSIRNFLPAARMRSLHEK